jgi:hypothetical protein
LAHNWQLLPFIHDKQLLPQDKHVLILFMMLIYDPEIQNVRHWLLILEYKYPEMQLVQVVLFLVHAKHGEVQERHKFPDWYK